jgi:hypothetical protein
MVLASKTKTPSMHHKKRNGQHHKVTKSYHKTYWPYLPLIAIIGFGIGVNSLWGHASHEVLGDATDLSAYTLLSDTNAQRGTNSEAGLHLNTQLDNAAQAKASNMVAMNYWSHDTPSGQTPWDFITAAGYNYKTAGENLAYGFDTSAEVMAAWMASPDHRANILNTSYKDVGFGIASSTNYQNQGPETVVVAEYGDPAPASSLPATAATISAPAAPPPAVTFSAKPTTPPSTIQPQASSSSIPVALDSSPVSRLQIVGDDVVPLSAFTVTVVAVLCFAIVVIRHGLIWRRVLRKGERFAVRYHLLDVAFVTIGVIGFIITRSTGYIH